MFDVIIKSYTDIPPNKYKTYLSSSLFVFGQKGGKRSFQRVGIAADGVRCVAVVRTLAVKA